MQTPTSLTTMTAIIDGLKFETKKAVLIGFSELDCISGQKFLFRTAKGRFFLQSQNDFNEPKVLVESVSLFGAQSFWNTCEDFNKLPLTDAFPGTRPRLA